MFSSLKDQTNNILKQSNLVASFIIIIIIIIITIPLASKSHRLVRGSEMWINYEIFLHQPPVSADGQKESKRSMKRSIADCGPSCTCPPSPVLLTHSSSSAVQQITLTLTHTQIKARPRPVVTSAARVKPVTQKEKLQHGTVGLKCSFKWKPFN